MVIEKVKQLRQDIKAILIKSWSNEHDSYLDMISGKINEKFVDLLISEKKKSLRSGFLLGVSIVSVICVLIKWNT